MIIKNSSFITSVADKKDILDLSVSEFAFVGRSNCGKSSLINFLVGKKNLAKTSSTPGHTKLVNYFLINKEAESEFVLVDLPGYGFSKAGKRTNEGWSDLIEAYLINSKNLKRVFVLVDIRRIPSELDCIMVNFLYYNNIPFFVVATKSDKIAKSKINVQVNEIAKKLKIACGNILVSSSEGNKGKAEILKVIEENL